LTTEPPPALHKVGYSCMVRVNADFRLVCMMVSYSLSEYSMARLRMFVPTLLIRQCSVPSNKVFTASTTVCLPSPELRSATTVCTLNPRPFQSCSQASNSDALRAQVSTVAPMPHNSSTQAFPMPLDPPVTTACFPLNPHLAIEPICDIL
jgi:hypothetical protein